MRRAPVGEPPQGSPIFDPIPQQYLGSAALTPEGKFEAGSFASFVLTYTAGRYGIDDSGAIRVAFRFATDQSAPQFTDPAGPGYTTVEASNNAVLDARYDPKGHLRPWDRALTIRVVHGFLKEGDTITVRLGDTRKGSPGMRVQTFCEDTFEFRVFADPIATGNFQALATQPVIQVVPGPPQRWVAVLPTLRRVGEPFTLRIKSEDRWGNPSDQADVRLSLKSSRSISGLPASVTFRPGQFAAEIDNLTAAEAGDVWVELCDAAGVAAARSNTNRIVRDAELIPFWGDMHAQSEEAIGTNSAESFLAFGRDLAFVDVIGHQGNDFQITSEFWARLNRLTAAANDPGKYVTLPGYEWSGNTALGGDRNVYFASEGRPIRRSSHALVLDRSDVDLDCFTAAELFQALRSAGEDAICVAHCGGRYADVAAAHDGLIERAVEVHSSWGTFEWLLRDALGLGHRVGVVANSDGHKGRPGAEWPGASMFGAYGGLTCLMMPRLDRAEVFRALRQRHHFGTTGARLHLSVTATFDAEATLFGEDPKLAPSAVVPARSAMMGDIVGLPSGEATLNVSIAAAAPIERLDIFNGLDLIETVRPYRGADLGNRIRVVWEGAAYRGRYRQVVWDGSAKLAGNKIAEAKPINFFNPDKKLEQVGDSGVSWRALTTGNFGGFDCWLENATAGTLELQTPLVKCAIPVDSIGLSDTTFEAGGLDRRVRIFRLPDQNPHYAMEISRKINLKSAGDNPLFVRLTLEDGHQAWSSPIYLFRNAA